MRTHVEWLKDCHGILIQVFERFTDVCTGIINDDEPGEWLQHLFYELSGLHDDLRHEEIKDALEFWAIAYAANYRRFVDGKYASFHEALYSPIHDAVVSIREMLQLQPEDWLGVMKELKQRATVFNRYARVFAENPGLLNREMADVINRAEGCFQPMDIDVSAGDPFRPEGTNSIEKLDISIIFEADLKRNRVRHGQVWYDTSGDGALLFDCLIKSYPDWFPARTLFTKPSVVKNSLCPELLALIETNSGKGYRLKFAPEAPQMRRTMPGSPAH